MILDPAATAMVWRGAGRRHERVLVHEITLGPKDMLVQVELATVCGSDVHTVLGHRPGPTPVVLGHEQVGRVVAMGASAEIRDVHGIRVRPGDRLIWGIGTWCGACDTCRRGLTQKCRQVRKYGHSAFAVPWLLSGSYATHVQVLARTPLVVVPESPPAEVLAPVSCATATVSAVLRAAFAPPRPAVAGSSVLIYGAGMLGLLASAMSSDRGARVTVVDPVASRRELACTFGAIETMDPRTAGAAGDFDVVLELSGARDAARSAVAVAAVGGVIVLAGTVSPGTSLDWEAEQVVRKLLTISGVHNYQPEDLAAAVAWTLTAAHRYPLDQLVSGAYQLDRIDDAIADAATGAAPRVAVRPVTMRGVS